MAKARRYAYWISTGLLVFIFGAAGLVKIIPQLTPQDINLAFGKFVTLPPISYLPVAVAPHVYRTAVGLLEFSCSLLMVVGQRRPRLQRGITYTLLVTMAGALFSHCVVGDPVEKFVPAAVSVVILLTRLLSADCHSSIKTHVD